MALWVPSMAGKSKFQIIHKASKRGERIESATFPTLNVDLHAEPNVLLRNGTEQGTEMDQPINSMRHHNFLETFVIQNVGKDVGPCGRDFFCWFPNVGHENILLSIFMTE